MCDISSNWLHLPKHASLISVLSVLWMIFTTKITASGVRNEIAWEEIKDKQCTVVVKNELRCSTGSVLQVNCKITFASGNDMNPSIIQS